MGNGDKAGGTVKRATDDMDRLLYWHHRRPVYEASPIRAGHAVAMALVAVLAVAFFVWAIATGGR